MKRATRLVFFSALLAAAAPAFGTSLRLDKVMDGKEPGLAAEVRGAGGYYGDCIRVDIINDTGETITVNVPLGLVLVPDRQSVQTMVCPGGERLEAGPGRTTHKIKAFCGEEHDSAPGTGTVFSNGGRASGDLLKRLQEILRDGKFDSSTQRLVWNVTQKLDLAKGAGPSSADKKATGAAALTTLIMLIWQIANGLIKVPGGGIPAPVPDASKTGPYPEDEEPSGSGDDRPSWSLMHRGDNDIYDAANERWVDRNSERAREMFMDKRREMSRKGYDYDEERDAFVKRGLEYDEKGDAYRESIPESRPFEIDKERGDASKINLGPGILIPGDQWLVTRADWLRSKSQDKEDYKELYKRLEDRLEYLDSRQDDAQSEHDEAARQEKKARQVNDEWLAEQWRKRREEALENVRSVQEQKRGLIRRVDERDKDANSWAERQKKSWTFGKVAKELKSTVIPDPEDLRPIFEQTLKLRNRLQKAIDDDPKKLVLPKDPEKRDQALDGIRSQKRIFGEVDETIRSIKEAQAALKEARDIGDGKAARALERKLAEGREKLKNLNAEMQNIHKLSAQWQAGSVSLSGTAGLTGAQYYGQTKLVVDVGKSAAKVLKPTIKVHRPRMLDEKGNIIGKEPQEPAPGPQVADGSAASPEDLSRRQNYEFYAVKKDGSLRSVNQAGNVDAVPQKGELIVIRDKATGTLSKHRFYGEGAGEKAMHQGQKDLLWKRAQESLGGGGGEARATGAGASGGEGGGGAGGRGGGGGTGEGRAAAETKGGGDPASAPADADGTPPASPDSAPAEAKRPPRVDADLRRLVPKRETFQDPKLKENVDKLLRGEEPDFSGAKGHEDTAAAWTDHEANLERLEALRTGKKVQSPAQRYDYWKAKDPNFEELDKVFSEAYNDAKTRMIKEVTPEIVDQMKKEGWTHGQEGFDKELMSRLGSDRRIHNGPQIKEYYFENMVKKKPDVTPFDEDYYINKAYEYRNKPISDQPDVPAPPSEPEVVVEPPVEPRRPPEGPPPGKTVVPSSPSGPPPGPSEIPGASTVAGPAKAGPPSPEATPQASFEPVDVPPSAEAPAPQPAAAPRVTFAQAPASRTPAPAAAPSEPVQQAFPPDQPASQTAAVPPPIAGPAAAGAPTPPTTVPDAASPLESAGDLGTFSREGAGSLEGLKLGSRTFESISRESVGLERTGFGAAGKLEGVATLGEAAGGLEQGSLVQQNSQSFARMLESLFGKKE